MDTANVVHSVDIHCSFHCEGNNQDDFPHLKGLPSVLKSTEGQTWKLLERVNQDSEDSEFRRIYTRKPQGDQDNNLQVFTRGQRQKLSLTLGSHVASNKSKPSFRGRLKELNMSSACSNYIIAGGDPKALGSHIVEDPSGDCRYPGNDAVNNVHALDLIPSSSSVAPYINNALRNSKYLKPAQQLLDEFVLVSKAAGSGSDRLSKNNKFTGVTMQLGNWSPQLGHTTFQERNVIFHNQCLSEENFVSSGRIRRLLGLLDELDSRYEQYCRQIGEVISSFEVVVGIGAANSYTGLTIQAMSQHFFNLRDAIITQIHALRESILEDSNRKSISISQPSLSEQKTKQNRTLQNLAMIQVQRVWRPLRGLPENSVAVLRGWLFEHFLHPYPNDNEKQMLASTTGLTKNQISNWFINARVRLWKPMIEEMYREEFAETSADSNTSS